MSVYRSGILAARAGPPRFRAMKIS